MRGVWLVLGLTGCTLAFHPGQFDADDETPVFDAPSDAEYPLDWSVCPGPIACPTPTGSTKLTICGRLYDVANNALVTDGAFSGNCDPMNPTTSGPCSLSLTPYDLVPYGLAPATATPLSTDSVTVTKCGQFRVAGIETSGTGEFIALRIDDATSGAGGTTVPVLIAVRKASGPTVQGQEAFVVSEATTTSWSNTGGPSLANGSFAAVFRKHVIGVGNPRAPQAGAAITTPNASTPRYFSAAETDHLTIDPNATVTGANGTALLSSASIADAGPYSGTGGLGAGCQWLSYPAAVLPNTVFVEVFRKANIVGQTCSD